MTLKVFIRITKHAIVKRSFTPIKRCFTSQIAGISGMLFIIFLMGIFLLASVELTFAQKTPKVMCVGAPPAPTGIWASPNPGCSYECVAVGADLFSIPANNSWYWQTSSTGTATTDPYNEGTGEKYDCTVGTRTWYLRAKWTDNCSGLWSTAVSIAITVNQTPANPGNPTSNSPQCADVGVTLTKGTCSAGTCYWQGTNSSGTSTANSAATYNAPSTGTYYIRAQSGTCWSSGSGSIAVTVNSNIAGTAGTWNGQNSTSWSKTCNWANGTVPTSGVHVIIPAAASNNCVLSGTANCNNITIENTRTLTISSGTLNIYGNFQNDGTWSAGAGATVAFVGSATQTVSGTGGDIVFDNLTVNNTATATITLNKAITVNNALTLTNGYIATTSANILNMAAGSSTSGTSASSFVDGPMTKTGSTDFTFPVGDGTRWARIGIFDLTASGAPSARNILLFLTAIPTAWQLHPPPFLPM